MTAGLLFRFFVRPSGPLAGQAIIESMCAAIRGGADSPLGGPLLSSSASLLWRRRKLPFS